MATKATEVRHELSGDWTISGVVTQIDSLSHSLQSVKTSGHKQLHIDCARIDSIDMNGVQLIHVWMECGRMHDLNIQLVNVPERLRHSMRGLIECDAQ